MQIQSSVISFQSDNNSSKESSAITKIQNLLKDYGRLTGSEKEFYTNQMLSTYNDAISKLPHDHELIFYSSFAYGRFKYGINYPESTEFLSISLEEMLKWKFNLSMETLSKLPIEEMFKDKLLPLEGLYIAQNLRWLGHTYQNRGEFNKNTQENIARFDLIYDSSEKILKEIIKTSGMLSEVGRDANWELIELYYNTSRFRYGLTHIPAQDPLESLKPLEMLKDPLALEGDTIRALKIKAQIENINFITLRDPLAKEKDPEKFKVLLDKSWKHICQAVEIASNSNFPDSFLAAMFHNSKARIALKYELASIEQIAQWLKVAIDYAEEHQNLPHMYFYIYYETAAQLMIKQLNITKAKDYLKRAMEICSKFLPDQKEDYDRLQKTLTDLETDSK